LRRERISWRCAVAEREVDHELEDEQEPGESGAALPVREAMSLVGGTSLFGTPLLDPTQTLASDPAAGTPAAGAADPNSGVVSATEDVAALAQTAQQSDSGAVAENIESDGSVTSATTPPPDAQT
jgi:hypothetical protein